MARLIGKDGAFHYWRSLVPVDPRERALSGHQPPDGNLGHDSAPWGSMELEESLETAAALEYAMTGNESDGTIAAPASGHTHDEGVDTYLGWSQIGAWPFVVGNALGGDLYYNSATISATSDTPIAMIPFVLPGGVARVIVRAEMAVDPDDAAELRLRLRFYQSGNNLNSATAAADAGHLSISTGVAGSGSFDGWVESAPIDLSGIVAGDRRLYLRVDAAVPSSRAYLRQIQIAAHNSGARVTAKATLDTTLAVPGAVLPGSTLQTVYKDNVSNLFKLAYGTARPLPRVVTPHDHGQGGGEILSRHLAAFTLGPHGREGVIGTSDQGTWGLPLNAPAAGVDFTETPKLLVQAPLWVPGGLSSVGVRLAGEMPGTTTTITVEVRPLSDSGYATPGAKAGVTDDVSLTQQASGANLRESGAASIDLTTLGNVSSDRLFELCLWQASNPAASNNRLLTCLVLTGTVSATPPDATVGTPRDEIPIAKIKEGQELSTLLTARTSLGYNQVSKAVLGAPPGLETDLHTPRTDDAWRRLLIEPHQHRGIEFTDPVTGERRNDGAVIRTPLLYAHYAQNVAGGDPEGTTSDADPARGQLLQNGYTGTGVRKTVGVCSIPRGLGAIDIYGLVEPGTTETRTRLFCLVDLRPYARRTGPNTIATFGSEITGTIRSGRHRASAISNSALQAAVQVDPQDGPVWQRNADRLHHGKGLWTQDAKLREADLPDGTSATHAARWTQPIRVEITPSDTLDHRAFITFVVQLGTETDLDNVFGTYDDEARLLAVIAVPAAGF